MLAINATCRACNGPLARAFDSVLMGDVSVTYHRCVMCGSLMLLDPHWLDRAYSTVIVPDPDFGALRRTLFVHRLVRRLQGTGILPHEYRSLDFGSGLGMLVRLQRDQGIEAWGYDIYSTPKFAEAYCLRDFPPGQFDLITCVEVLEHTTNPIEVLASLRSVLREGGVLVITTELVDGQQQLDSWHYLAREHGQHVTLFSQTGLSEAAKKAGFRWVTSIFLDGVPFLHVLAPESGSLSRWRLALLRCRQTLGEALYGSDATV